MIPAGGTKSQHRDLGLDRAALGRWEKVGILSFLLTAAVYLHIFIYYCSDCVSHLHLHCLLLTLLLLHVTVFLMLCLCTARSMLEGLNKHLSAMMAAEVAYSQAMVRCVLVLHSIFDCKGVKPLAAC